ncbi:MAG: shikimate dehydrogenase [Gammaproteobacteria bacterium]|nr:shikimate dehydrogenase [Sideroxydans sp.]MBU3902983.1 shikimate dehydrogenase [Gammaproteobacteria bacterium]MBU4045911.1 shikimate dehydrogenase [Gammaproteobacteria bacterium]MBU4150243.1 shikimate dehydrogenase [Gammaproteobacteria bacterium]
MTDRYAVIGNPISHSKSPLIHRMFAEQTGQDISYEAIEAPLDGFAAAVERLRNEGYKGCNVTVPFKSQAHEVASILSDRAQIAKAVNTLTFDTERILGDNTDGVGLVRDIEQNRSIKLRGKNLLLLGAGGAAQGVSLPILEVGANLFIYNRTAQKAQELSYGLQVFLNRQIVTKHGLNYGLPNYINSFTELSAKKFDLIVNATSTGLSDEMIPLPDSIFAPGALAYDMMYGRETPFMKFARDHDAQVADGLGMLVEQAAEAFLIWRGVRPDTSPVLEVLRK